jgi:predicted TIM-barrel fold metal-dependent hydrolase
MVFDADTHMSPYRNFDLSIDAEELVELLSGAGVDKALCWLMPLGVTDVSDSNRYIYESSKKHDLLVPFGWTNVREGLQKALRDARQCISEFGFAGVKLNGAQNEYPIDSPEALAVCECIAGLGGIIAFHIGSDAPDLTSARRASFVAERFPETPIIMVHMGGAGVGVMDRADEVIAAAQAHPNMILTGSAIAIGRVEKAIDILGPERVMYGSDAPFSDVSESLDGYRAMLNKYDEYTRALVMGGNAQRLFGVAG